MRSILVMLVLAGCDTASQVAPDAALGGDLAGAADLARPGDLGGGADLLPPPDLACPTGQFFDGAGCVVMHTPQECADENREFVLVAVAGYCGACLAGFEEHHGRCVIPSCTTGNGTLGALCATLGRTCSSAGCDPCSVNSSEDPATGACVFSGDCAIRAVCPEAAGFYCGQLAGTDAPRCHQRACSEGQAWNRATQTCLSCACGGVKAWPFSDRDGKCICEPPAGSYYNRQHFQTAPCDADGDGWLNKEVQDELRLATLPPAPFDFSVIFNVRCAIPQFTKAILRNEWHQDEELTPSELGVMAQAIPMYEHPDNDTGMNTDLALIPRAGGVAALSASSVNSLTKACHSTATDLNKNHLDDYKEHQADQSSNETWSLPYQRLTHFIELYTVRFVEKSRPDSVVPCLTGCPPIPLPAVTGELIIEERSRCDADFPMAPSDNNWQNCTRRRDSDFQKGGAAPLGYDFASFECAGNGECTSYTWPSFWPTPTPPKTLPTTLPPPVTAPPVGQVPPHGLCNGGVVPDSTWRGMTHYSQFMCASIVLGLPAAKNQLEVQNGELVSEDWEAQSCLLADQAPPSPSPAPGTHARFACSADAAVAAGEVTWVARRFHKDYTTPGQYHGGCISEGAEWWPLCPGSSPLVLGSIAASGSVLCGPACARDEVFYNSDGTFWICAHPTASVADPWTAPSPSPQWRIDGEFSISGGSEVLGGPSGFRIK